MNSCADKKHYRPISLMFSPGSRAGSSISANLFASLRTLKSGEKLSAEVEMESDDIAEADLVCTEFSE